MGPKGYRRIRDAAVTNNFFNQATQPTLTYSASAATTSYDPVATTPSPATPSERDAYRAQLSSEKEHLQTKIAVLDGAMKKLEKEMAAGGEVKEEKKKVKDIAAANEVKGAAAAGEKKKKRKKKRSVPTGLGVSGFAQGENPHKGKFVFGQAKDWMGDLEWMMAVGMMG